MKIKLLTVAALLLLSGCKQELHVHKWREWIFFGMQYSSQKLPHNSYCDTWSRACRRCGEIESITYSSADGDAKKKLSIHPIAEKKLLGLYFSEKRNRK